MNKKLIEKHTYYNNEFFKRWAKHYDLLEYFLFPLRKKSAQFIDSSHIKVLDVATGNGAQAVELAKRGYDVTGIDLSPHMLAVAQKKIKHGLKLRFQVADGTNLPFKDNSFDASTISLGLHDMPYEIELKVLKEMKRVTKKDGEILIVDHMEPSSHWMARVIHPIILSFETRNYQPFVKRTLAYLLRELNMNIHRGSHYLGLFQIGVVKNRK